MRKEIMGPDRSPMIERRRNVRLDSQSKPLAIKLTKHTYPSKRELEAATSDRLYGP